MPLSKEQEDAVAAAMAAQSKGRRRPAPDRWRRRFVYEACVAAGLAAGVAAAYILAPETLMLRAACAVSGLAAGMLVGWRVARSAG